MTQIAAPAPATADLAMLGEVSAAAKAFAAALADTLEFRAFEEGAVAFKHDRVAQEAVRLFEEKQGSLRMMQQLGVLEQKELDERNRLRDTMMNQPAVRVYVDAQNELTHLCQAATREISGLIDYDFAGACASGCCG
jgi:cell fate (sporulation/competence/biofilm development) regulator YlbF (YheA/YmcA/DUF963 family)